MKDGDRKLPDGWVDASLNDLGEWKGGGTPSKSNKSFWTGGIIPWVSPKDMKRFYLDDADDKITKDAVKNSSAQLFPADSVLVVTRSGILERTLPVAINRVPVATNQDLKTLIPAMGIDSRYVAYFLKGSDQHFREECAKDGTTVASIDLPKLKTYKCDLAPLAEQRRIVAKIEALQERSRKAREALAEVGPLLEQFRQSLLAAAFRGDLTADWRAANPNVEPASELLNRIRQQRRQKWEQSELAKYEAKGKQPQNGWHGKYKEPAPTTATESFKLPTGWCWTEIESVSDWVKDGTHWPPKTTTHGIPFIGIRNVIDGRIDWTTIDKWVSEETHAGLTANFPHRPGDVLYTAVGATFGRAFPIEDNRKFIFQRHIAHIRPFAGINADYIIYALNSPNGFSQAKQVARGAAQPTVTLGDLKRIRIPLCSNEEQEAMIKRIVNALSTIAGICEAVAESKSALTQLDQSILAKAFRGELVPQDPNDEPASVLLERIRDARQSDAPTKSSKQKDAANGRK